MKSNAWTMIAVSVVLTAFILEVLIFIGPSAYKMYVLAQPDEAEVAYRDNYKLHTTPLSQTVVDDLCSKLGLKDTSPRCEPGAVVYAPELFDEIKLYFRDLSRPEKTYETVQKVLGPYLVACEAPDFEGYFRCRYDLQGDSVYPLFFDFDQTGHYWQIIAHTGGDS